MTFFRRSKHAARTLDPATPLCSCGTPLDLVDMDYGFQLPDVVFAMTAEERRARIRGLAKVFLLDESRGFVRTMLPVKLDHGSVTFGIWLEVPPAQVRVAQPVWDGPEFASLSFTGTVANLLAPWGNALLGAEAEARPRSNDELPFVTDGNEVVRSLLHQTWPRAAVTAALPNLRHDHG